MKKNIIWLMILICCLGHIFSLEYNSFNNTFRTEAVSFSLTPILKGNIDPTHYYYEQFVLNGWEQDGNIVRIFYVSAGYEYTIEVDMDGYLMNDWHKVQVHVTALADLDMWNLGLKPIFDQNYTSLDGAKAIMYDDASQNREILPYMQRNIDFQFSDGHLGIIASNIDDTPGIEMYYEDALYFYHSYHHWANFTTYWGHRKGWRPMQAGETLDYQFIITESKPLMPYLNPYPEGKKAALAITNDADSQYRSFTRAMFWGSSDETDDIYGTRGLIPNNITLCHTIFGCDYDTIGDLWMDIKESGSTIGLHTFSPETDDMQALEEGLHNELAQYDIRMWIDHSWALNPETICREGWDPESEFYVMDILRDANIDYAWVGNSNYDPQINGYEDPKQLPHRLYAIETERPIWYYERLRCEFWLYKRWPIFDFFHNVSYSNLSYLLDVNGFMQPYTHFFIGDNSIREGFLYHDEANNRWIVRDDVEACLEMIDDFQQNKGLWVVPTEHMFDRMRAVDSVYVTQIVQEADHIRYTFYNGSSTIIDDFETQLLSDHQSIPRFHPHTYSTLEFEYASNNELDQPVTSAINSYLSGSNLHVKINNRDISIESVGIYNIRGQRIVKEDHLNTDHWIYDMSHMASGVYLIKAIDGKNQQNLMKAVYVK